MATRDVMNSIGIGLLTFLVAVAGWLIHPHGASVAGIAIGVTLLGALFIMFQRQNHRHFLELKLQQRNDYRQVEALFRLHSCLTLPAPLPPMRNWAASPDFAALIVKTVCEKRPQLMVEFGSGVSTLVASHTLRKNGMGRMISIDHDSAYADATRAQVRRHGLDDIAQVIYAPLLPVEVEGESYRYYDPSVLDALPGIDLLVIDGPPEHVGHHARYPALPLLRGKMNPGCIVLLDDANRVEEQEITAKWLKRWAVAQRATCETEKGAVELVAT